MKPFVAGAVCRCAAVALLAGLPVAAQVPVLGGWNPLSANQKGVNLYSVWGGASYFGNASSPSSGNVASPRLGLPSDTVMQTGAAVGWSRGGRFPLSVTYMPTYIARKNFPEFNRFNHGLRISTGPSTSRDITSRWSLRLSTNVSFQDMMNSAFNSPFFGGLSGTPDSLMSLSSVLNGVGAGGQFPFLLMSLPQQRLGSWGQGVTDLQSLIGSAGTLTDAEIAARLTGAPVASPSWNDALYQTRVFTSSLTVGLDYKLSQRLTFSFGTLGSFSRFIDSAGSSAAYRPFQRSLSAGGYATFDYGLTRGMRVGVNLQTQRQFSTFQDGFLSHGTVFAERRYQRWFIRGDVGVSQVQTIRQTYKIPNGLQMYWNGSAGLQTSRETTIVASFRRSAGDSYGIGGATTTSATTGFRWNRPYSRWSVFASGAQEQLENPSFGNIKMYHVAGGTAWRLGWNMSLQTQLFWMKYNGGTGPLPYNAAFRGASMNLVWTPHPERPGEGAPTGPGQGSPMGQ